MAPVFIRADPCPCCGLAHDNLRLFATGDSIPGQRIKLWYVCPEFGERVPVDFGQAAPPRDKGN